MGADTRASFPGTEQWVELAKLAGSGDWGSPGPVAIHGNTIALGEPCECNHPAGAASLFLKLKEGWNSSAPAVDLMNVDDGYEYGLTVAVSNNMAVVADPDISWSPGYAFVFLPGRHGWERRSYVVASLGASDGQWHGDYAVPGLGASLAISGNTVVAGGPYDPGRSDSTQVERDPLRNRGAVFVFVKPATGWANMTETAKLTASHAKKHDGLGSSVAMSGNTVVAYGGGAEYVFVKPARGWKSRTQTAKLTASDGSALGSVAIAGDTVVTANGTAVYLFVKPKGGWANMTEMAKLTASDGTGLGNVAISGNIVVATGGDSVYIFVKPASGWITTTETDKVSDSDAAALGPVSISGSTVVAGAQINSNPMAYVFGKSQ